MKPIKCPHCGKRMIPIERGNAPTVAWMACALDGGCGVRGPIAEGRTGTAAVRLAARLTREWIERMEADSNALINHKAREVEYLTEKRCAEELRNILESTPFGWNAPVVELLEKWEVTP
jgi:hypothetical protein